MILWFYLIINGSRKLVREIINLTKIQAILIAIYNQDSDYKRDFYNQKL